MLNPADLYALEEAISLKERFGGETVVFTMAPPDGEKALRTALAMGMDEGRLVTDRVFGGGDTIATARVLAAAISYSGRFDIVLAGSESSDGATGQVGPMIAEYLGMPHVTPVRRTIGTSEDRIEIEKKVGGIRAVLSVALPALIAVGYGCNVPRLTTLRSQIAAKKKNLVILTNKELKLSPGEVGQDGSFTEVTDTFAPEREQRAVFISGSAQEAAAEIIELVEQCKEEA
jgi:electron transfer flavoprotein beta subunit